MTDCSCRMAYLRSRKMLRSSDSAGDDGRAATMIHWDDTESPRTRDCMRRGLPCGEEGFPAWRHGDAIKWSGRRVLSNVSEPACEHTTHADGAGASTRNAARQSTNEARPVRRDAWQEVKGIEHVSQPGARIGRPAATPPWRRPDWVGTAPSWVHNSDAQVNTKVTAPAREGD